MIIESDSNFDIYFNEILPYFIDKVKYFPKTENNILFYA